MQQIKAKHTQIPFAIFPQFTAEPLVHGVFNRRGGVSLAPYTSLNISYHVGDNPQSVQANRQLLKKSLALPIVVSARQVHGDKIHHVKEIPATDLEIDGVDGLITDCPLALMIQQADCQAVIFHDPRQGAIGACHAGWRGSMANIIAQTVTAMMAAFGSRPADLVAAISPALGACCAEFINYKKELAPEFHKYRLDGSGYKFDFIAISRDQLQHTGIKPENIHDSGICTRCDPDFYSYRRHKITGRFCTIIGLRG